jgi:hypothetical protein
MQYVFPYLSSQKNKYTRLATTIQEGGFNTPGLHTAHRLRAKKFLLPRLAGEQFLFQNSLGITRHKMRIKQKDKQTIK